MLALLVAAAPHSALHVRVADLETVAASTPIVEVQPRIVQLDADLDTAPAEAPSSRPFVQAQLRQLQLGLQLQLCPLQPKGYQGMAVAVEMEIARPV